MCLALLVAIATGWNLLPLFAATRTQTEVPAIAASGRLFPELGPGLRALKRDSIGQYYILAASSSTVSVYGVDGKRIGEIPAANSQIVKIVFAEDIDVDASNRVFIADLGANAVKIFKTNGSLDTTVAVPAPTSVAALPGNEFAVTSLRSDHLVTIYSEQGKLIRSFGDFAIVFRAMIQSATSTTAGFPETLWVLFTLRLRFFRMPRSESTIALVIRRTKFLFRIRTNGQPLPHKPQGSIS